MLAWYGHKPPAASRWSTSCGRTRLTPEIGGGLDEETRAAREAVSAADRAQRLAAAQSRATARRLRQAGLSGRDIAKVLNVSPQRVSQLLRTGT